MYIQPDLSPRPQPRAPAQTHLRATVWDTQPQEQLDASIMLIERSPA